jgi:phage terminase large subunit GpA-like protein
LIQAAPHLWNNDNALRRTAAGLAAGICRDIRPRRFRTMRQWAEQEFVIPEGDYQGTRFRADVQPAHAVWLDEIDSGRWNEHFLIAGAQGGKSVAGFLIPLMYHLFERTQTVICGVPLLDLVSDKWLMEIFPAIEASRYRDLLPHSGAGSKGGVGNLLKFQNGAALRFMTGGGSDKTRSSFTAPVLVTTETEGFADVSASSTEKVTPLDQLKSRTSFYGSRARIYHECTLTTELGIMWTGHTNGSGGQLVFECHGCGNWIHPEKADLVGWQDAPNELRAKADARWSCPHCGILIEEPQRKAALKRARIIHRGESIDADGQVIGNRTETEVLSFRFGASGNAFKEPGVIGVELWRAKYQLNSEASEVKLRALDQWTFATPVKPEAVIVDPLDIQRLLVRQSDTPRGFCPEDTFQLTAGCDIRKTQLHWFVIAWSASGPRVVDFGIERVPSGDMPVSDAIQSAGETVQELFQGGFRVHNSETMLHVTLTLADAGWETDAVELLCAKDPTFMPSMGFGAGLLRDRKYVKPKNERTARIIGQGFHVAEVRGRLLVELDANKQKSLLHKSLSVEDLQSPHALLLPKALPQDLREMVYELTSEVQQDRFKPGIGVVTEWKPVRRRNHFLDAAYQAFAARVVHDELQKLLEEQQPEEIEWDPQANGFTGGIFR